ncbi:MAG TPA: NAD-dependent epimerase/dehydratase family protein, partial [Thermoanaerobaculia bacterium]
MNILVTGGAGFIGSHMARRHLSDGHRVVVLDNLSTGRREAVPEGARFAEGDIATVDAAALLRDEKI